MRRHTRLCILAAAIGVTVLVGACMTFPHSGLRKASSGILFDHAKHIEEGLECDMCHEIADGLASLPNHETCSNCHEINEEEPTEEECRICHANEDCAVAERVRLLGPELIFSHEPHVAGEIECGKCHPGPGSGVLAEAPSMSWCMDCHGGSTPELNECAVCHSEIRMDVVPSHRAGNRILHDAPELWEHVHGPESRAEPAFCAICHESTAFCGDCHESKLPRNHTIAWRRRTHGQRASWDRRNCAVCHEEDSCVQCHKNTKPRSHRGGWDSPLHRHCRVCHFPARKTNCVVCHESIDHHTAQPSPHNFLAYPTPCSRCHRRGLSMRAPHPLNSTAQCLSCH